jgi:hypothetical protein
VTLPAGASRYGARPDCWPLRSRPDTTDYPDPAGGWCLARGDGPAGRLPGRMGSPYSTSRPLRGLHIRPSIEFAEVPDVSPQRWIGAYDGDGERRNGHRRRRRPSGVLSLLSREGIEDPLVASSCSSGDGGDLWGPSVRTDFSGQRRVRLMDKPMTHPWGKTLNDLIGARTHHEERGCEEADGSPLRWAPPSRP